MNKKAVFIRIIGFVLSLTLGQFIVIAAVVYMTYFAGRLGLFG